MPTDIKFSVRKNLLYVGGCMEQAVGMASLEEAFNTMNANAGANLVNIAQVLAERFPRRMLSPGFRMTRKPREVEVVEMIGEVSPAGMCIVHWPTRLITWSNGVYRAYFSDLENQEVAVGARIDNVIPDFEGSELERIFKMVAATGNPFSTECFELDLPSAGKTFWNWSLTAMPGEAGLLVQMHQVKKPALTSVA